MNSTRLTIHFMKIQKNKDYNFKLFILFFSFLTFTGHAQTWHDEAWTRIDTHRKSDLSINLVSESGIPINGAVVKIKLKRHAFNFGSVMRSEFIQTSPYSTIYKENYLKYFNGGGYSLGLKPKQRGGKHETYAEQISPWFNENNIEMRGHAFIWEGESFLRPEGGEVYNNTSLSDEEKGETLLGMLDDHLYHTMPKWDVKWWDVINEPVKNNIVNKLLPDYNTFTHWFKLADSLRTVYNKDFKMVLNENQVISGNSSNVVDKLDEFKSIVAEMLSEDAPIEMLGFQFRIKNGMLSPETLYNRLLEFDQFNLPMQATEFEVRDSDNYTYSIAEVKQQTEDAMLSFFSHPKAEGFWHWTFVDNEDGEYPWALFNYDGTPKATGEKWIELMEGDFDTNVNVISNASGKCFTRGFKGEYEIEINYNDTKYTETLSLIDDKVATIKLPVQDNEVNLITNGDFDKATISPWIFYKGVSTSDASVINRELFIDIATAGQAWQPQLIQNYISISTGGNYQIQFNAKAAANRTIILVLKSSTGSVMLNEKVNLTDNMQTFTYTITAGLTDSDCSLIFNCGSFDTSVTLDNVSISDESSLSISTITQEFEVYPNPNNTDYLNIKLDDLSVKYELILFEISGKILLRKTIDNNNSKLNISKLSVGSYFITISSSKGYSTKKIIIN